MTTIAYDAKAGVVAADSQETSGGGEKYNCQKLFEIGEHVIATAGGTYAGMAFVNWFKEWTDQDPDWSDWNERPDFVNLDYEEDFECLVIQPDRKCYTVNRLFVPVYQSGNRFITLGSGGSAARGAMLAGATPREAIDIAKKIDTYTGGKTVELAL